jgi:hypothetical protein
LGEIDMKRKKKLITVLFLSLLSAFSVLADQDFRNWTNKDGNSIEAKFIKFKDAKIEIRRKDGFTFTLDPSTLSQEDQDYLKELEKHRDQTGRVWHKGNYQQVLVRQKWFDLPPENGACKYFDFTKEMIDLDNDGKVDGYKVRNFYKNSKSFLSPKAWEMDEDGILTYKYLSGDRIIKSNYKYDFGKKSFIRAKGYYGPRYFILPE